jgi:hypothetical protein
MILRLYDLIVLELNGLGLLTRGDRVSSQVDGDGEGSLVCSSSLTTYPSFSR